ncbi:hypothetical protein QCA50_020198 [Cerrena zonata]|uniref:Alpha-galactosidase n=1 Tax=Cerrena zonata TaxID=2478898 RepID=A0AAW0FCS4_9APHY
MLLLTSIFVTVLLPYVNSAPSTSTSTTVPAPTVGPTKEVGKLPALGWNTWNAYACSIDESKVLAAANQFVSLGLKDAGYKYVNIDDCWSVMSGRDNTTGRIVPDPTKFPDGISGLASKIHALGLKIGIYSDAGTKTCAGYPGSLGNEAIDAETFTEWGIDYLKYDNCNVPANWSDAAMPPDDDWYNSNSAIRYRRMTVALDAQPRPVQFNLCIWGTANVWDWGARVGHSWRMSGDASASWSYIVSIINTNAQHLDSINFWSHNDMDMMEIGNGDLTIEEQRTHFATWVLFKSPILLGTDLGKLSDDQLTIIKNKELLEFHQDPVIGTPAAPFTPTPSAPTTSTPEYFVGRSLKGTHVFVVNTAANTTMKTFNFANVKGLARGGRGSFKVHDMWTGKDIGKFTGNYTFSLAAHDTAAFFVSPL